MLVEIMEGKGVNLDVALGELWTWVSNIRGVEGVWGNGPTFDVSMLEHAFQQAGMTTPWHYRTVRDVRTMAMIAGDDDACWNGGKITDVERNGKAHNATVDCLRQLRMVQQTWQRRVDHEAPKEVVA